MKTILITLLSWVVFKSPCLSQTKDSIFPSKNISIQEIVIKGKKASVQFQLDRKTFNASAFGNAANGNGIDLVKNLPGMSLNGQQELMMRGSQSFIVLINGKPTQGDPSFVLAQLPASQIENIEVISAPGAQYDAEGKSGVLNIITKSAPEKGLLLQTNLMGGLGAINNFGNKRYGHPQRRAADFAASWKKNKLDISTGFNYLRNDAAGMREGDAYTVINGNTTSFPSVGERSFKRYNYGGRFLLSYEASSATTFDLGAYVGKRYQSRVADIYYNNMHTYARNSITRNFNYYNENTADKQGVFSLASLGLNHRFESNALLSVSIQYEGADLESRTYNANLQSYGGAMLQLTDNPGENNLHALRAKADITQKKNGVTLAYGYQFRYDVQKGIFKYYYKNAAAAAFTLDPNFSSSVQVNNSIQSGYMQINAVQKKLSYQAGLRAELTKQDLTVQTNSLTNRLNLLNLFPSYQINYTLNKRTAFKTALSRRIKRTNNYELNPIPEREHSETLEQGDPALLPEISTQWEIGSEHKWSKGNLYISAYHMQLKNPIQRVNSVYNDTILNRIFTNASKATQTGVELNLT